MSRRFTIKDTSLAGLKIIERHPIRDARGFLERMFCADELAEAGIDWSPVQVNRTLTRQKGAARGLHYQAPPHAEEKFVHCLRGAVYDVAVDLRRGSPTFGQWHAEELSEENCRALLIPRGFAHGFQALSDNAEMLYFHSAYYAPDVESGINLHDERLGINWPHDVTEISARDAALPRLTSDFQGLDT